MTTKVAKKTPKTRTKTIEVPRVSEIESTKFQQNWELVTFIGFGWEEAKKYEGAERAFLLERAAENKVEFLKRQKKEEEERLNRERHIATVQQHQTQQMQMQQMQQMQQPPNPYGPPQMSPPPQPQQTFPQQ